MATDHRGSPVGNPETSHGGHRVVVRDWSRQKDSMIRNTYGYNHPTGPTTSISARDMGNVRSDYRSARSAGKDPQAARAEAIQGSYRRKEAEIGSRGWGPF